MQSLCRKIVGLAHLPECNVALFHTAGFFRCGLYLFQCHAEFGFGPGVRLWLYQAGDELVPSPLVRLIGLLPSAFMTQISSEPSRLL